MSEQQRFINLRTIEEDYGIKPDQIKRAIKDGALSAASVGRETLMRRKDVEAWFESKLESRRPAARRKS